MKKSLIYTISILILLAAAVGLFFGLKKKPSEPNQVIGGAQNLIPIQRTILAPKPLIISYVINGGATSFGSLKTNLSHLNIVIGDWLHMADAAGTVVLDNPQKQAEELDYIRSHDKTVKVFAMLNNYYGGWREKETGQMLADAKARKNVIDFAVNYAEQNKLDGISSDLEGIPADAQANFVIFLGELQSALHDHGMQLSVNAPFDDSTWNYAAVAQNSDQVIVMDYDQHTSSTDPGPVAAKDWFNDILKKRSAEIPTQKLVVGMGNYAYDWTIGKDQAHSTTDAAAFATAAGYKAEIKADPASENDFFEYTDSSKNKHVVWMLDAESVYSEVKIAQDYAPFGLAVYRLGSEDQKIWQYLNR